MKFEFSRSGLVALVALCSMQASAAPGLAPISQLQSAKIDAALNLGGEESDLKVAVREAAPNIAAFLKINSCLAGYNGSALNAYAAPGKTYPNNNYIGGPMPTMYKHSKSSCVTVLRIHGWTMPTKNSLRFEVVYTSEDSGEAGKGAHEVQRQPSGEWLFTR